MMKKNMILVTMKMTTIEGKIKVIYSRYKN